MEHRTIDLRPAPFNLTSEELEALKASGQVLELNTVKIQPPPPHIMEELIYRREPRPWLQVGTGPGATAPIKRGKRQ